MTKKVGSPSPTQMRLYNSYTLQMIQYPVHFVENFNKVHIGQRLVIAIKIPVDGN